MSNLNRSSETRSPGQQDISQSSQGNNSRSVTPRDVAPEDASARDMTDRDLNSHDLEARAQALLDEAVEQTFPASDPIAVPTFEEALEIVRAQDACAAQQARAAQEGEGEQSEDVSSPQNREPARQWPFTNTNSH